MCKIARTLAITVLLFQATQTMAASNMPTIQPAQAASSSQSSASNNPSLRGVEWKLDRLRDKSLMLERNQATPYLIFDKAQDRVTGSSGCNRFFGGFEMDGTALRFAAMAGTRMACAAGMDLEQAFLTTFDAVTQFRIDNDRLYLTDPSGTVLMELVASSTSEGKPNTSKK